MIVVINKMMFVIAEYQDTDPFVCKTEGGRGTATLLACLLLLAYGTFSHQIVTTLLDNTTRKRSFKFDGHNDYSHRMKRMKQCSGLRDLSHSIFLHFRLFGEW